MKTAIVGAGAMGSLFGGLLAENGADVWLIDVWADHVRALNKSGLRIEQEGRARKIKVKATCHPADIEWAELVIIFVKANQTEAAARTAKSLLDSRGLVLTLQNGMGNADIISGLIEPYRVVAGTTSQGATVLAPGKIRHAGKGPTIIGAWAGGDQNPVQRIADLFNAAGIPTETADDIRSVIWEKLLINVGINAITALTGIANGQLPDLAATRALCRSAVEEAMAVAAKNGIKVRSDAVEYVLEVARTTGANRSSMGQDVDHKRQTEIDVINGFIVREASKAGVDAPVNRALTALIETLQAHYA